jgi:transposase
MTGRSPEKRSIDQPSKYDDPKIQKIILDALEDGNYLYIAARLAGVAPDTLHEWIGRGRGTRKGVAPPSLVEFVEQIDLALARWEAKTVKKVHEVAQSGQPNTWQAAMTMLERKSPDRWGKREKLGVEIESNRPLVQVQQLILQDEETRHASREFLRRVTSMPGAISQGEQEDIEVTPLDPTETTPTEEGD